jgi:glycerol transport system ATP-binding protein
VLELIGVEQVVDGEVLLEDISLQLDAGDISIILGATGAGKTTLLRMMAGLERPTAGDIRYRGESVLGVPVQRRNVAMVYQQFINYPSLSVFENIASPLRVARLPRDEVGRRVRGAAEQLHIDKLLERRPDELSGGQQQRVALARALVKGADLVLLDEPLANLDYKLREELRTELPRLFAEQGAVLVYATTEPTEALILGGRTAVLHEGRLRQYGDTAKVFTTPCDITTAVAFSDPPLNVAQVHKSGPDIRIGDQALELPDTLRQLPDADYDIGIRPHHIGLAPGGDDSVSIKGRVSVNEITGSESFIHFDFGGHSWVALVHGVHPAEPGESIQLYLRPDSFYVFRPGGDLVHAPSRHAA